MLSAATTTPIPHTSIWYTLPLELRQQIIREVLHSNIPENSFVSHLAIDLKQLTALSPAAELISPLTTFLCVLKTRREHFNDEWLAVLRARDETMARKPIKAYSWKPPMNETDQAQLKSRYAEQARLKSLMWQMSRCAGEVETWLGVLRARVEKENEEW